MSHSLPPFEETPPRLIKLAKALRRGSTDAEGVLWQLVRRRGMGVKFRRQHPVVPYVLDFYCHALRLAVEVDGGQHAAESGRAGDARRSAALKARGIDVLRFSNLEVLQETSAVADALWHACQERLAANRQASTQCG